VKTRARGRAVVIAVVYRAQVAHAYVNSAFHPCGKVKWVSTFWLN